MNRRRPHYTDSIRCAVLAAAKREGLTARQVQQKFGIQPVTYYAWHKAESLRKSVAIAPDIRRPKSETPRSRASWSTWADIPPELEAKARELRPAVGPFGLAIAIGLARAMRAAGLKPLRQQRLPLDAPRRTPAPLGHSRRRESPSARAPGHSEFSWSGKEGWAQCAEASAVHYWRHGRTLCGAYTWKPGVALPTLKKAVEDLPTWPTPCRRCVKRSSSAMRPLWRDRRAGGAE